MDERLLHEGRQVARRLNRRVQMTIPSILADGETFCLGLTAFGPDGLPSGDFDEEADLDEIALRGAPFHPDPFVVYYARIETGQHQTQWTSPIWLDL